MPVASNGLKRISSYKPVTKPNRNQQPPVAVSAGWQMTGATLSPCDLVTLLPFHVVAVMSALHPLSYTPMMATFQDGLNQIGFDSRNVAFEYHWAEGDYDLLPWFAATLVNHKVAAIIAGGGPAALAAKSATTTIPIIFSSRANPIQLGLITALKQPGGNITGVVSMSDGFVTKQIKLIHEVVPSAALIAVLVQSKQPQRN